MQTVLTRLGLPTSRNADRTAGGRTTSRKAAPAALLLKSSVSTACSSSKMDIVAVVGR